MRCLIQISDLHFGRNRFDVLEALKEEILRASPHLLVVTGDLTDRAKPSQFKQAQDFLKGLPFPQVVVPGNHDVPIWNIGLRLLNPMARYKEMISADLSPSYEDQFISVQGINTAYGRTLTGGRFQAKDLEKIIEHWEKLPPQVLRILVSHHPFETLSGWARFHRAGSQIKLPKDIELAEHADLILSGRSHHPNSATLSEKITLTAERSIITIQAGTAASSRLRGEQNSYNRLLLQDGEIFFERRKWNESRRHFETDRNKRFFTFSHVGPSHVGPSAAQKIDVTSADLGLHSDYL